MYTLLLYVNCVVRWLLVCVFLSRQCVYLWWCYGCVEFVSCMPWISTKQKQSIAGRIVQHPATRAETWPMDVIILTKGITIYWVKILLLENSRGKSCISFYRALYPMSIVTICVWWTSYTYGNDQNIGESQHMHKVTAPLLGVCEKPNAFYCSTEQ